MATDPLVTLMRALVVAAESGRSTSLRRLASDAGFSFSTTQRLHEEMRRRGWLDGAGMPTVEGLVACGRV